MKKIIIQSHLVRTVLACALTVSAALPGTAPTVAFASAPMVGVQAPGFYRLMVGDYEVTALSDGTVNLPVENLLHQPAAKTIASLKKSWQTVPLETSVNAFLVNTGTRLILIDAGGGGLFGPVLGKLLANLQAAGYKPEQIDDVLITHLHPDHVGGLVAGGAVVFPNATIHANERDATYWLSQANLDSAKDDGKAFFQGAMTSLTPYIAASRFQTFSGDAQIVNGVRSWMTAGHTPGHTSYVVESRGQRLVVIGDLIHVAGVQLDAPSVTIDFDSDRTAAAASRARAFTVLAKEGDLVAAAHIAFPGIGRLRAAGRAWQWIPVPYTNEFR